MKLWKWFKNLLKQIFPPPTRTLLRETGNLDHRITALQRELESLRNDSDSHLKQTEKLSSDISSLNFQLNRIYALFESANRENLRLYTELRKEKLLSDSVWEKYDTATRDYLHLYHELSSEKSFLDQLERYNNVIPAKNCQYGKLLPKKLNIGLYYYKYPNFGDLLNELLIQSLFGDNLETSFENFTGADMIAIGSILDRLIQEALISPGDEKLQAMADKPKPIHVWGTGLMYHYDNPLSLPVRNIVIHALRGELTRIQLCDFFDIDIQCPLADPGLLSSLVIPAEEKKWAVGIVPHYVDEKDPLFDNMKNYYHDSVVINVHDDPAFVLKQISQCERILSTSLHGLVVADSYNIPNCWCVASDKILGSGYKYHDYFSAFGTDREAFHLQASARFPDLNSDCSVSFRNYDEVRKKQVELIRCFPFGST